MKNNTNTTLELPEGSKATIQGKEIDGKYYLVVEVEQESEKSDAPEWTKFKRGDVLIYSKGMDVIFVIFGEYRNVHSRYYFNCKFIVSGSWSGSRSRFRSGSG